MTNATLPNYNITANTGAKKKTNPFWYREPDSNLIGVTAANSNISFGIQNIKLHIGSAKQLPHGILANGIITTVVGTFSFQIQLSKSNAPFVQTTSEKRPDGTYWQPILLRPQVKAQILRHFEAWFGAQQEGGTVPAQAPAQAMPTNVPSYTEFGKEKATPAASTTAEEQVKALLAIMKEQGISPNAASQDSVAPENVDQDTGEILDDDIPL